MSGGRAFYRQAGAAMRQALARAGKVDLSPADRRVLDAVLVATVSWSRLEDEVPLAELADAAGCSERQARRSLARLSALGIVVHRPGRGRSKLTLVGVPACEKSGQMAVRFCEEEKRTDRRSKSGQDHLGKADNHARARRDREGPRRSEKDPTTATEAGKIAQALVGQLNETWGTAYSPDTWPAIEARVRERPDADHEWIQAASCALPWWDDPAPTPNVIYGSRRQYEKAEALAARIARDGPPAEPTSNGGRAR